MRRSSSSTHSRSGSSRGYTPAKPRVTLQVDENYYVAASTLNLRAEPSADAEVLRVLSRNDVVQVVELTNDKWAKETTPDDAGELVTGYVSRAYLAAEMTY